MLCSKRSAERIAGPHRAPPCRRSVRCRHTAASPGRRQYGPRGGYLHLPDSPSSGCLSRLLIIQLHGIGTGLERFRKCPVAKHAVLRMGDREAARTFGHEMAPFSYRISRMQEIPASKVHPDRSVPSFRRTHGSLSGIKTGRPDI